MTGSIIPWFIGCIVAICFALYHQWQVHKLRAELENRTPSACDEVIASCVVKIRTCEKWAGIDGPVVTEAWRDLTVQGERFRVSVRRSRESEDA